jgi:hypothetical protein
VGCATRGPPWQAHIAALSEAWRDAASRLAGHGLGGSDPSGRGHGGAPLGDSRHRLGGRRPQRGHDVVLPRSPDDPARRGGASASRSPRSRASGHAGSSTCPPSLSSGSGATGENSSSDAPAWGPGGTIRSTSSAGPPPWCAIGGTASSLSGLAPRGRRASGRIRSPDAWARVGARNEAATGFREPPLGHLPAVSLVARAV